MIFQRLLFHPKTLLGTLALAALAALLALFARGAPALRVNLGLVERNRLIIPALQADAEEQAASLAPALAALAQSGRADACNPLGLAASLLAGCARAADWGQTTITDTAGTAATFYLAPPPPTGLLYRQGFTLLLPEDAQAVEEITLLTYMAHSTRIAQGDTVGVAVVTTADGRAHVTQLRMGSEIAEAMYDTPDIPPQHSKPPQHYPLPTGGLAYPVTIRFDEPITPASVAVVFTYPGQWHVNPLLFFWGVGLP